MFLGRSFLLRRKKSENCKKRYCNYSQNEYNNINRNKTQNENNCFEGKDIRRQGFRNNIKREHKETEGNDEWEKCAGAYGTGIFGQI